MLPPFKFIACLLACLALSNALAAQFPNSAHNSSGGELLPEQASFDVQHYSLKLRINPGSKSIRGQLSMRAKCTDLGEKIILHLDQALKVDKVLVMGKPVKFKHEEGQIHIPTSEEAVEIVAKKNNYLQVTVHYHGQPRVARKPPWDGGFTWSKDSANKNWIATTCQGEGADLWWPCKDHPSDKPETMDLFITVPKTLICASNGTLQATIDNDNGTHTFHWHIANPISNYNVALNIGAFAVIEEEYTCVNGDKMPVFFWVRPRNEARARKALPEFLDHMRFMEEICGPYPFRNEKYGIVETPHLGMEHQTIIAYGNNFRKPSFNYDWLHHHEMSHEWWANLVTCRDWKDFWIHEGIGTYMQALYIEKTHGKKGYQVEMQSKRRGISNRHPLAPLENKTTAEHYGIEVYNKGSWVMHSLRWLLQDEVFFKTLRRMAYPDPEMEKITDGSQVRFSDTEEIRSIAEKVSGQDLGWFFAVYLRQAGLPKLQSEMRDGHLHLQWQVPNDLPFPMPVPVQVGEKIHRVAMPKGKGSIELSAGRDYQVDPEHWLLRRLGR